MKIILKLITYVLDSEISWEEFKLNWNSQVPHWNYLTDEGISFFKGERNKKWKKNG